MFWIQIQRKISKNVWFLKVYRVKTAKITGKGTPHTGPQQIMARNYLSRIQKNSYNLNWFWTIFWKLEARQLIIRQVFEYIWVIWFKSVKKYLNPSCMCRINGDENTANLWQCFWFSLWRNIEHWDNAGSPERVSLMAWACWELANINEKIWKVGCLYAQEETRGASLSFLEYFNIEWNKNYTAKCFVLNA